MNRHTVAGAALLGAPVLVAASHFLWPAHSEGSDRQQIVAAGAHPGAWLAATVVETIGWLLLVPALIDIWATVQGRGRVLAGLGAWLTLAGMFGYFGAGLMNLVTIQLGRRHDPAAMAAVMHSLKHDDALFWMLVAPLLLGTLALVVLFAGLARAQLVGWWAPVAALVSVAGSQALSESDNAFLLSAALLPLIAASAASGAAIAGRRRATARTGFESAAFATS